MMSAEHAEAHFNRLIDALNAELKFEREQYEWLMHNTAPALRAKQGVAWFPLRVIETGFGLGDYPFVVFERTQNKGLDHQLSGGKPAMLFSDEKNAPLPMNGALQWVDGDRLQMMFFIDDHPELLDYSRLGVQMQVDESSYKDMKETLARTRDAKNNRTAFLRDCSFDVKSNRKTETFIFENPTLNPSQNQAVKAIVQAEDFHILHGPPGTGKTTTLVAAAQVLIEQGNKLMLCAPSNAATDWLLEKCIQQKIKAIRIGNISRMNEQAASHSVEGKMEVHPEYKDIKYYKKKAAEFRQLASKYKRNLGYNEREQRRLLYQEARNFSKEASSLEEHILNQLINDADAVICTLNGANNRLLYKREFDVVMIDEAAQALEPSCWIPIQKAKKVILAGDPFQLPPTVKSPEGLKLKLNQTLMERMMVNCDIVSLLKVQYRMNKSIMGFSNLWFYNNQLEAHEDNAHHGFDGLPEIMFVDTAGCGFQETMNEESRSFFNEGETQLVQKILNHIATQTQELISIGIIAPYKQQVNYLKEHIQNENQTVKIQTIDSFQGQEQDVIIISLTRSNEEQEIGFLKEYRRMNVAMTRARKSLWLIGDSATLANDTFYNQLIDYAEKNQAYQSAWEWIHE
jgi:superfamily I DNA and/or RNA helicase